MREPLKPFFQLAGGERSEILQFSLVRVSLRRKLEIEIDELAQQARQKAQGQLPQSRQIIDDDLARVRRIAIELLGFEIAGQH